MSERKAYTIRLRQGFRAGEPINFVEFTNGSERRRFAVQGTDHQTRSPNGLGSP
jgi:hypothetical protein